MYMSMYSLLTNTVFFVFFFLQHRDTPENNADTPFELNQKNLEVSKPSPYTSHGAMRTDETKSLNILVMDGIF